MYKKTHQRSFLSGKRPFSLKKKPRRHAMAYYDKILQDVPDQKRNQFFSCMEAKTDDGWDPGKKFNVTSGSLFPFPLSFLSLVFTFSSTFITITDYAAWRCETMLFEGAVTADKFSPAITSTPANTRRLLIPTSSLRRRPIRPTISLVEDWTTDLPDEVHR